jgi:hypothetical protein
MYQNSHTNNVAIKKQTVNKKNIHFDSKKEYFADMEMSILDIAYSLRGLYQLKIVENSNNSCNLITQSQNQIVGNIEQSGNKIIATFQVAAVLLAKNLTFSSSIENPEKYRAWLGDAVKVAACIAKKLDVTFWNHTQTKEGFILLFASELLEVSKMNST